MKCLAILILLYVPHKTNCSLIKTAVNIAKSQFKKEYITSVIWESSFSDTNNITEFLTEYDGSVVTATAHDNITSGVTELFNTLRCSQVVIFASTSREFDYISRIIGNSMIEPLSLILLLTSSVINNELKEVTNSAWTNDIVNIVILSTGNDDSYVNVSTFMPYGNSGCGDTTPVPMDATSGIYFPRKFKNFYGCPINIALMIRPPYVSVKEINGSTHSLTGLTGGFFAYVLEKLNITMNIVFKDDFLSPDRISDDDAFIYLTSRRADVLLPGILASVNRYENAQITGFYKTQFILWFGPHRREINEWAKVIYPFYTDTTPYIILSFILFIIVIKFIRRYALCKPNRKAGIFFQTFVLFLGQGVNFETKYWLVNSIFVLWIWFCMIVRMVYQGDLVQGLQKVFLEPPLGPFNVARTKVNGFGGLKEYSRYYKNNPSIITDYQVISSNNMSLYVNQIARGKRFLIAADLLYLLDQGVMLVYVQTIARASVISIHMRRGWQAAPEVKNILDTLNEHGFLTKIYDDFVNIIPIYRSILFGPGYSAPRPLGLMTLGGCFLGLLLMYLVCFLIFCGEVICHKYKLGNKFKFKVK